MSDFTPTAEQVRETYSALCKTDAADADFERQRFTRPGRAQVNVQWKGIPSCFDIYCECGVYAHLDDEYFGRWKCGGCGRSFKLASTATAYEVEPVEGEPTTEPEKE